MGKNKAWQEDKYATYHEFSLCSLLIPRVNFLIWQKEIKKSKNQNHVGNKV